MSPQFSADRFSSRQPSEPPAESPFDAEDFFAPEDDENGANLTEQAVWVLIHTLMAVGSWVVMMGIITFFKPESVPVLITLALSFTIPLVVGNIFTRIKQNEMGPYTWLIGLIWFLIVTLWILDMPTGPNQCFHCDASQKLYLTFLSPLEDSGLIDGQGRLVGTWPTAALVGYGIGSRFALKRKAKQE